MGTCATQKSVGLMIFKGSAQIVVSSLTVAERFGMTHSHVLRLLRKAEHWFRENTISEYERTVYKDSLNRSQPLYYMNRNGLNTFICCIYAKGPEAERYVNAYEALRKEMLEKAEAYLGDPWA